MTLTAAPGATHAVEGVAQEARALMSEPLPVAPDWFTVEEVSPILRLVRERTSSRCSLRTCGLSAASTATSS